MSVSVPDYFRNRFKHFWRPRPAGNEGGLKKQIREGTFQSKVTARYLPFPSCHVLLHPVLGELLGLHVLGVLRQPRVLKALGAVQAASDRGRDQEISKQEGTSETAGPIRNGGHLSPGTQGTAQGSLFPLHPP